MLLKGAIVGIDRFNPPASVIVYQYNTDTLTRTSQPQNMGTQSGDHAEVTCVKGAPVESIRLDAGTRVHTDAKAAESARAVNALV